MNIQRIPFAERIKYVTASDVAAIVKHYSKGKKRFKVFREFDEICSVKKWTPEQQATYREMEDNKGAFQKNVGKDWEHSLGQGLYQTFEERLNDTSGASETLLYTKYRLGATPDFVIVNEEEKTKILNETKGYPYINSKGEVTDRLPSYKYQVATQLWLLTEEDRQNGKEYQWNVIITFAPAMKKFSVERENEEGEENQISRNEVYQLEITIEELVNLQREIRSAVNKFWQDFEAQNFNFISFDDWYKKNVAAEEIEITDQEEIDVLENLKYYMQIEKEAKDKAEKIKDALRKRYVENKLLKCPEFQVSISKSSSTMYDLTYYLEQKGEAEDQIQRLEGGGEIKIVERKSQVRIKENKKTN